MKLDAVDLTVFGHRFASIADEMGVSLQRTGHSPNIKERRDYSCALFDASCEMIAQAAHIPVHLGSMAMSTRAAVDALDLAPGDAVILNDPYAGGTHLPDITVVSPVFIGDASRPRFYVANRAHHADVGGITPGSMPLASHIDEEGLRIEPQLLMRAGEMVDETLKWILGSVRTPAEREGDLRAQLAANFVGARRIEAMCAEVGVERASEAAAALLAYAERLTRAALAEIPAGTYRFSDVMDGDGLEATDVLIEVAVTVAEAGTLTMDFTGTAAQVPGSINAVEAITVSACEYVLRCIAGWDVPANGGVSRAMTVIAPEGSLVNAGYPAPVAAGNVETSQRIVDVLLGALAQALPDVIPAASCGTMNNVTLGGTDPRTGQPFAYYETIAGGAGAGPGFDGASGVQTHMTNTLNTPVEALEHSYPFRVRRYAIRRGSGGAGRWRGGDGVVRELEVLTPATATLLTERRLHAPWGLAGGEPGLKGENLLFSGNREQSLPPKASFALAEGDILAIRTPGGGGYGDSE